MLRKQDEMILSEYSKLYDIVVPKDNELRKLKELVDFSFIYDELTTNYSINHGRTAIDPIRMFKYLLLKVIYDLSDVDIVKRSQYDMSFKFFLDMAPEEDIINPSSLTKFRRLRLKNIDILDMLIQKSVSIANEHDLLKSETLILDATHSQSRYNVYSTKQLLNKRNSQIKKSISKIFNIDIKTPKFDDITSEEAVEKSKTFLDNIKTNEKYINIPDISKSINLLEEAIEDSEFSTQHSYDNEARIGHKSKDSSFYGYKTHIAMDENRIITAATVSTGEKADGKELNQLLKKSLENGVKVSTIVGDGAYSSKTNLDLCKEKKIDLVSKLNPSVTHGYRKEENKFEFNKDANMYVCPAGHLAVRKARTGKKNQSTNQCLTYYFDIEKCKICPLKEGCYKGDAKSKTYSVSIKSKTHFEQMEFMKTEKFKLISKKRYMIEAKNSELKNRHGMKSSKYAGLLNMEMQAAATIFVVNLKRITKLIGLK